MTKRTFDIAFFGSSLVSAYWNGAATYYRGIIRALAGQGHRVTFYEPDAYDRQKHRDIDDPPYAKSVVYPADEAGVNAALEEAEGADIIIKASGVGVFDEYLESAVLDLQSPGRRVLFWDVDAPATLERIAQNPDDPFRRCIPRYDLILTYGGGDPVVNAYMKFSAKACIPVYNALDEDTHYRVESDVRFDGSLAFLGNRMPDREARVWDFFFTPAKSMPAHRFILGGSGWDRNIPDLANLNYLGHVYTADHNAFNCTPMAVLNINRDGMARFGFSPPTRVFEAAGAGACIITDAWEGIELFLEPGKECLVAKSGEEVKDLLFDLTRERSRKIGSAAMARVLGEHTYAHRGRQLEEIFQDLDI